MDRIQALQAFLNSFLPAYEENAIYSAPIQPKMPYLTYEGLYGLYDSDITASTSVTFQTWFREVSPKNAYKMTERISKAIGGKKRLDFDDGYMFIKKESSPFGTLMGDDADDVVKRMVHRINITVFAL